ncbi:DsbA family protein [Pantoea dispersa]|uniref:DsbA family protein n=1 Tax=Pantoea dispersa TaxID=59814 RepID=UPI0032124998
MKPDDLTPLEKGAVAVTGPENAYNRDTTADGALLITPTTGQDFTIFLETATGPAESKVIVTEFFDYECIACSMMSPVMEKVMASNPDVRFAFRDWTIFASRFPESTQASRRGLDVFRQKGATAYIDYHNGIYRTGHNEGKLTAKDIETAAKIAGAGPEKQEDYAKSDSLIANNDSLAELLGLTGTPGIIVMPAENASPENTTVIPGVVSEAVMQQAIKRAEGK